MKNKLLALLLALPLSSFAVNLPPPVIPGAAAPLSVPSYQFSRGVPLSEFVLTVLEDNLKVPFFLCPEILDDKRLVGVSAKLPRDKAASVLSDLLRRYGYQLNRGDIYRVELVNKESAPTAKQRVLLRPSNRSVSYFAATLPSVFPDVKFSFESGANKDHVGLDAFYAQVSSDEERKAVESAVHQLDTPVQEVSIRAMLVEVSDDSRGGHGFLIASRLLSDRIGFSLGTQPTGNMVSFKAGSFEATAGVFDADSRFRTLTSPTIVVGHGKEGAINASTQIPYTTSTTVNNATQQNVAFIEAGTKLTVKPEILNGRISLSINLELSEAQPTAQGSTSVPSVIKRTITSNATIDNQSVLLLGGLSTQRESNTKNTFFGYALNSVKTDAQSELVLVLYAELR